MVWIGFALLAVCILLFLITYIMFRIFIMRAKKKVNPMPDFDIFTRYADQIKSAQNWFLSQNPQPVSITSFDGLTLRGHILPHPEARGTVVFMHGYHGTGLRDFSCALRAFYDRRLNIVLPDQRANGESEGTYVTFGTSERYDCRDWILFANRTFGDKLPVVLDGVSMGAATVMLACALDLPSNVVGAIADCGYTSPCAIVKHVLKNGLHFPIWPFLPIANLMCRIFAGFSLDTANCIQAVKSTRIPILFAHGEADSFVPVEMGTACHDACTSEKRLFLVPDADHGMSYLVAREEYEALLDEFIFSRLQ
ncbi:MAG: alpha/beta hydrolase [Clostridiales bacterium]|nr:alpha/beta hydrolase [Clostridiales bacterium]